MTTTATPTKKKKKSGFKGKRSAQAKLRTASRRAAKKAKRPKNKKTK